jgi:hypothetical protein
VVVSAAPLAISWSASVEADEPWLAELQSIVESRDAFSPDARRAVRRVVRAILLEGCSLRDAAQAERLLLLL